MNASADHGGSVRVVIIGLGTVGTATARLCRLRPWIDLVGGVGHSATTSHGFPDELTVSADADELLDTVHPDIVLVATRPTVGEVLPDIERCIVRGIPVICTAEELALPGISETLTVDIGAMARAGGVAVAAAGINPGYVFDALPLAIAGAAWDVDRIHISRALDVSVFGREVHRSLGVGYPLDRFHKAVASRTIRGHRGFEESASIIAGAMGRALERFEDQVEPVVAEQRYELAGYTIEPGQTGGVTQHAVGWVEGRPWIDFDLSLHVDPSSVGLETRDRIRIEGENSIDLTIEPGTRAVLTTAARLVNTIPAVLRAAPGLYNSSDLLPASPWLAPVLPDHRKSD